MKIVKSRAALEQEISELRHREAVTEEKERLRKGKTSNPAPKLPRVKPKPVFQRSKNDWDAPLDTPTVFPTTSKKEYGRLAWKDGRLVDTDIRNHGFMQHTETSAAKTPRPHGSLLYGVTWSPNYSGGDLNTGFSDLPSDVGHQCGETSIRERLVGPLEGPLEGSCAPCETIEAGKADTSDQSLEARSRLDLSVELAMKTFCWIIELPIEQQMRLLEGAYDLVRQGMWEAVRTHWPLDHARLFPLHWKQVRFGFEELQNSGFGDDIFPGRITELCGRTRQEVYAAMYKVIDLRNAVCHPGHSQDLISLDRLLAKAQGLLVLLQDEDRTFGVRNLRQEAYESAWTIHQDLDARDTLDGLPEAKHAPWPLYLQLSFQKFVCIPRKSEEKVPEVFARAALRWESKGIWPGEDLVSDRESGVSGSRAL